MNIKKSLSPALLLILLTGLPGTALQAEVVGKVIKSQNMDQYPAGTEIEKGTEILTGDDQKIAIKTDDGDVLVAGSNAKIKIREPGFFSQLFGKIYYLIAPRDQNKVKVTTSMSTIGIRGTKFIVASDENETGQVALSEGELVLESNDDEKFELYHERELTEFEQYKRQQMKEFSEFKQQMMEEFIAYKASIDLDSGFALKFDGKKVVRTPINETVDNEFAEFEQFLADNQPESIKE